MSVKEVLFLKKGGKIRKIIGDIKTKKLNVVKCH